jgi:hypothetical protein
LFVGFAIVMVLGYFRSAVIKPSGRPVDDDNAGGGASGWHGGGADVGPDGSH